MHADLLQSMRRRNGIGMQKPEHVSSCFERPSMHLYTTAWRRHKHRRTFRASQSSGLVGTAAINDDDLLLALELPKFVERARYALLLVQRRNNNADSHNCA